MPESHRTPIPLPTLVGDGGTLPEYASAGAAGADLRASEAVEIAPGGRAAVPTGVRLQIPPGHVGLVWPRSGLAVRHGIDTLAGVIDSDYRGEVRVVAREPRRRALPHRERATAWRSSSSSGSSGSRFTAVPSIDETERGGGGFGSTGR